MDAREFAGMMLDLERISRASVESLFFRSCAQYELSMNELRLLLELHKAGRCTVGEMSDALGILRGNMAGLAKPLERRGWIRRRRSLEDERVVFLELTEAGEAKAEGILSQVQERFAPILQNEPPETAEAILAGLKSFYALLAQI